MIRNISYAFRHRTAIIMGSTKTKDWTPVPKHAVVDTNQESYFIIDFYCILFSAFVD